jgi:hypothetical protein
MVMVVVVVMLMVWIMVLVMVWMWVLLTGAVEVVAEVSYWEHLRRVHPVPSQQLHKVPCSSTAWHGLLERKRLNGLTSIFTSLLFSVFTISQHTLL